MLPSGLIAQLSSMIVALEHTWEKEVEVEEMNYLTMKKEKKKMMKTFSEVSFLMGAWSFATNTGFGAKKTAAQKLVRSMMYSNWEAGA